MSRAEPIPTTDLEESAQGQDLFRAPGEELMLEQASDQAEASGWLPPRVAEDWLSTEERQAITRRRQRLYSAMQSLEAAAARASGQDDWADLIEQACLDLAAALEAHTAETEAADGLFAGVIDEAPRLSPAVVELRDEHKSLQRSCAQLLDYVKAPELLDPAGTRRRVLLILGRLTQHRQRGAELLFDAYNVDIATGD